MPKKKTKKVYVYHDADHGDIELFDSLEKAIAHTKEHWGDEQEWEGDIESDGQIHELYSDYVTIYEREIK